MIIGIDESTRAGGKRVFVRFDKNETYRWICCRTVLSTPTTLFHVILDSFGDATDTLTT